MKKISVTGKTVDDAIQAGLKELNATEDQVKIQIIEQPNKGLFGLIGSKEAKIEMELIPDPLEEAARFLESVFDAMRLDLKLERQDSPDGVVLNMTGDELGILIGRRGQTLDALQFLTNIVANRYSTQHLRIILDAENFRERRKETLQNLSRRLADRVVRTKSEIVLEPMSPQERKVIHSCLQNHQWVKTFSKGEDPNRRVVIALK